MKKLEYLSYTSLTDFYRNRTEFYRKYLADTPVPRIPQTPAMAVGTAFDAFVKSHLHQAVFGGDEERFLGLITKQIDEPLRGEAVAAGWHLFTEYQRQGAYSELIELLNKSATAPRLEFTEIGYVSGTLARVPVKGRPDLTFERNGVLCILDWKCNGYYSKNGPSPCPGYMVDRSPPRGGGPMAHKVWINANPDLTGVQYGAKPFEDVSEEYACQGVIYSQLVSPEAEPDKTIFCIEQLVCKAGAPGGRPSVRCVSHRARATRGFVDLVSRRLGLCWNACQDASTVFLPTGAPGENISDLCDDASASAAKCATLDLGMPGNTPDDEWMRANCR